ncbi:MAG: putative bifunctional diguanylate cyclase/phosphodiesterase [Oscillospiraceae bacterium]
MDRKKLSSKKQNALMILFILIYIMLNLLAVIISKNGNKILTLGRSTIPLYSINGIISGLQFFMCICMVSVEYKKGRIVSTVLIAMSIIGNISEIIRSHILNSLPGIINLIVSLISIYLLCNQLEIREKSIVTDYLTNLINRHGLVRTLTQKISKKEPFCVMYIDFENFKLVNDSLGHRCGDFVLKTISERIQTAVGSKGILGRIGGDEFIFIFSDKYDAIEMSNTVLSSINEKIEIPTGDKVVDFYMSAFVGISRYPDDAADPELLIKYADIAMNHLSKNKQDRINFFDKEMEKGLHRQMTLERIIKEGLKEDNFYLVYQPQYRLDGKKLRGFESLIRLKTSAGEFISPGEFIPVAERTDLILEIDDYVIRRAIREFKEPVEKSGRSFIVSVNISAKNIAFPGFAERLKEMLNEADFPAECFEVEITEYCLAASVEITIDNIEKLRRMGVHVALDDFGTGYTSLSYLAKLPINLLKIDKSLIDNIETDEKSREFANAVISLGHLMNCDVISEGVESETQLSILGDQNCDFIQGYVWGKPLEYEKAVELCSESHN